MEFSSLTFIVTDSCNFNCSYCYQKKGTIFIDRSTIVKAIDFFFPLLTEKCYINFSGGEPLLADELIEKIVISIQNNNKNPKKQFQYTITTNGSLINENILKFLNHHKFSLILSFDGLAQEISRNKGSFQQTVSLIEKILKYPSIDIQTNSVFTQQTVDYLSKSIQFIMELGIPTINLSISNIPAWDKLSLVKLEKELQLLNQFCLSFYTKNEQIPLTEFRKKSENGIFYCSAGKDRMTVTPDGKLWGCHLFADYFKEQKDTGEYQKYCFGDLDSFVKNHEKIYPEIVQNYSKLSMDYFSTPDKFCMLCDKLEECSVCPISAAFSSSIIGKITDWTCEIKKILNREKELFWKEIEKYQNQKTIGR